ncbi:MAG TPA: hypothetical protein VEC06_17525 [Paucimonas sp.]|nr:hypothetical protein [Paucimonas sp.]
MKALRHVAPLLLLGGLGSIQAASAQQLDVKFSCSAPGDDGGERVMYADNGEIRLNGSRIDGFRWESSLFRSTHGFDCSVDEDDGLWAEVIGDGQKSGWRINLLNAAKARAHRGYDFMTGANCTIRLLRDGDALRIKPSCPALCGSRRNFSELSVNLKTGACKYED